MVPAGPFMKKAEDENKKKKVANPNTTENGEEVRAIIRSRLCWQCIQSKDALSCHTTLLPPHRPTPSVIELVLMIGHGVFRLQVLHEMTATSEVVAAYIASERLQSTVNPLMPFEVAALSKAQSAVTVSADERPLPCVSADMTLQCGGFEE